MGAGEVSGVTCGLSGCACGTSLLLRHWEAAEGAGGGDAMTRLIFRAGFSSTYNLIILSKKSSA